MWALFCNMELKKNIPFEVVTENGKSVIRIDCGNKIGKIIFDDTEKREAK